MEEYGFFGVAPGRTEIVVVTVVCASLNLEGAVIPEANGLGPIIFSTTLL